MTEIKSDPNRSNGHNLIRALWQTITMRQLENTYLKAIDSNKDTIVNCHLRRRAEQLNSYADFLQSIAEFFEKKVDW